MCATTDSGKPVNLKDIIKFYSILVWFLFLDILRDINIFYEFFNSKLIEYYTSFKIFENLETLNLFVYKNILIR